jgi:thiamine kinase-like enzyme
MKLMQKIDKKIASVDHKIEIISPLKIDLISQIFLCNFNGIKSVIRIDFDLPNWLKKQRASEFQILNFLKTKTQNQKILYQDLDRGILIREFHEGKEISYSDIRRKENLISLGKEIKKVHEIKIDNVAINNFENAIENYRDTLKNKIKNNWYLNQGFKIFDSLSYRKEQIIFSHNDLNRENILFNKKYFFIDWEYASANSPYFDLASIISSYDFNDEEIGYLFDGYNKNFIFDQEKLKNWVKFTYFLDYIWRQCLVETTKHDEKSLRIIDLERNLDIFK